MHYLPIAFRVIGILIAMTALYSALSNLDELYLRSSTEIPVDLQRSILAAAAWNILYLVFGATVAIFARRLSAFILPLQEINEYAEKAPGIRLEIETLSSSIDTLKADLATQAKKLDEVEADKGKLKSRLSAAEKNTIVEKFRETLSSDLLPATIKEMIKANSQNIAEEIKSASLRRLGGQVEALGSRANRALLLGMTFAVSGLFLLFSTFYLLDEPALRLSSGPSFWGEFVAGYLPKLGLVLLTEIVAFYFLRLYTKTLVELRSAQNEITNVEMKLIALSYAISAQEDEVIRKVIEVLSMTERNAVIEKTQTTVEIERDRASGEAQSAAIKAFSEMIHGNERGWLWTRRG